MVHGAWSMGHGAWGMEQWGMEQWVIARRACPDLSGASSIVGQEITLKKRVTVAGNPLFLLW